MKKQFTTFLIATTFLTLGVFVLANQAHAETEVSGNITSDTTWTSANSPYNITDTLQVFNGAILTIGGGVEVKTATGKLIKIAGTLIVNGTNINPVTFTSFGIGKWGGIEFIDSNNSQINNSIIENAGRAVDLKGISVVPMVGNIFKNNEWVVTDTGGYQKMYFVNNTIYDNSDVFYGIRTIGNDNVFRNNTFHNNSSVFHHGYYFDITTIDNNNFINNTFVIKAPEQGYGYGTVSIIDNWWNTTDTNVIDNLISDKNDDVALQLLDYLPIKTSEISGVGSSVTPKISTPQDITCTSWTYSEWSSCSSSGQQTRSTISSSPNSCAGGSPVLTQSCTYTPPTCTSWNYSNWNVCANNQQTRTITSSQPASCVGGNPTVNQSCDSTPLCTESNWTSTLTSTNCPSSGQQIKKWAKIGQCQNGISHSSEESVSCNYQAPTCSTFTYGDWSICNASRVQSRSTLSSSPSACVGGNPVLSQSCNYTSSAISNKVSNIETKDSPPVSTNNQNPQNDSILTKNNEQEVGQEKPITNSQVAEQRKSDVASAVQKIIQITEKDSEVGQQVKTIAEIQAQSQEKLETSLQKVQSRSGFTKFFVGPNYSEINNAKKLLEQNREQIKQLDEIQNQIINKNDKQKLTEQVQLLEQTNQEIENSLNTSQKGFNLFGWIFRLFTK
ncbi:MAG: hypothetical protein A3C63_02060 [Candidatus Zambryskibacteria bacterium RIFCSPHIGHO2_02_FULL_39_82]|nr:MAG: hypothetical protein A3C63_02060 [Candidatus Zambryskibacteria bacterium RIFCSPHIGHO2_02_FULL_39_82]